MLDLVLFLVVAVIVFKVWKFYKSVRSQPRHLGSSSEITTIHRGEDEDPYGDTDNQIGHESSHVVSVQSRLLLHYSDVAGNKTKRLVDVREADIGWEYGYLSGRC